MKQYLFLGDSITDADHLFDPANLGYGMRGAGGVIHGGRV